MGDKIWFCRKIVSASVNIFLYFKFSSLKIVLDGSDHDFMRQREKNSRGENVFPKGNSLSSKEEPKVMRSVRCAPTPIIVE